MTSDDQPTDSLDNLIAKYLRLADAGAPPNQAAFIAEHPNQADGLRSFFRDQARFEPLDVAIRPVDPDATIPPDGDSGVSRPVIRYFGDYELLSEIARGGMGVVFRARQVSLDRSVAVKMILRGELSSTEDVRRFRAEAEAAAQLDHPNIVPIYEVGEYDGQQYFSMKLIQGGNLAAWLRAEPRPSTSDLRLLRVAARMVATVARAVHYAHQRGILHRDLKPGNILLDSDGRPFVADFGLAKRVEADMRLTQSGAFVGTPAYMSPEQARAEKTITTATDVYSLGAILYECLTGRPPFRAATPLDTVLQVLEQEPAWPADCDHDLATIALKCLEKDPARRYDSAAAAADELDRWSRGEPILSRPAGMLERGWKWIKRRPLAAALAATAAALVLLVGIGWPMVALREAKLREDRLRAENETARAKQSEEKAHETAKTAVGERDVKGLEAMRSTVEANFQRAQAIRIGEQKGRPAEAKKLLTEAGQLRESMRELAQRLGGDAPRKSSEFWAAMTSQLNDEAAQWLTESLLLLSQTVRPQAILTPTSGIRLPGGVVEKSISSWDGDWPVRALSPSGRWLARIPTLWESQGPIQIELLQTDSGTVSGTMTLPSAPAESETGVYRQSVAMSFIDDSKLIVAYHQSVNGAPAKQKRLLIIETRSVPDGGPVARREIDLRGALRNSVADLRYPTISISPDGKRVLIYQSGRPRRNAAPLPSSSCPAALFEAESGKLLGSYSQTSMGILAASPQGEMLVGFNRGPTGPFADFGPDELKVIAMATGKIVGRISLEKNSIWPSVAFGPDSHWVAVAESKRNFGGGRIKLHESTGTRSIEATLPPEPQSRFDIGMSAPGPTCAISGDGRIVAVCTPHHVHLFTVPDLTLLISRSHGLNVESNNGALDRRVFQPFASSFVTDGRLAIGYSQPPGWGTTIEEIWQFWDSSLATVPQSASYGYLAARVQQQPSNAVVSVRSSPTSLTAALAQRGWAGITAVDFSRQQRGHYSGPRGTESFVSVPELWGNRLSYGPDWRLHPRYGHDQAPVDPVEEQGNTDFDRSGRWLVFSKELIPPGPIGFDIRDAATGTMHRSFPQARLLAWSRDRRWIALREEFDPGMTRLSSWTAARLVGLAVSGPLATIAELGRRTALGSAPIRIWDLEADKEVCQFDPGPWGEHYMFAFSPDGKYFLGSGRNDKTTLGRVSDGHAFPLLDGQFDSDNYQYTFSYLNDTAVILKSSRNSQDGSTTRRLVELATGNVLREFRSLDRNTDRDCPVVSSDARRAALVALKAPKFDAYKLVTWTANGGEKTGDLPFTVNWSNSPPIKITADGRRAIVAGGVRDPAVTSDDRRNGWSVLELWNVDEAKRVATSRESPGSLLGFRICPAGNALALWFSDASNSNSPQRCEFWDLETGKLRGTHPNAKCIGITLDGKFAVLNSSQNEKITVVDTITGQVWLEPDGRSHDGIGNNELQLFSPDGGILCLNAPNQVILWHLADKKRVALPIPDGSNHRFSPDGRRLVSEDPKSGVLTVWDAFSGQSLLTIDPRGRNSLPGRPIGSGSSLRVSADNKSLLVNTHGQLRLFTLDGGNFITVMPRAGHAGGVNAVAASRDGKWIASAGGDRTVGIWHASNGRYAAVLDGYGGEVRAVEFTPDSRQLLTRDEQGHLALWQLGDSVGAAGELGLSLVWQHTGAKPGTGAAADPKAKVADAVPGSVPGTMMRRVNPDAPKPVPILGAALAIRPDGKQFALGNADGTITLARVSDGEVEQTLKDSDAGAVLTLSYRPDGATIAAAGADGTIRLWDIAEGKKTSAWPAGQGEVRAVMFHPDGQWLASAGSDVRLWQADTRQLLLHAARPEQPLCDLCFTPDRRWLLTGGEDGAARRIDLIALREALRGWALGW